VEWIAAKNRRRRRRRRMRELPMQCRARFNAIHEIARELIDTFVNGNKNTARDELLELEPIVALAVLSTMMVNADEDTRISMANYFVEAA
jgi:hypothetical protein